MKMELLRPAVIQRDHQRCFRCGKRDGYEWSCHHRRLKSQGGKDVPSNMLWLCGSGTTGCHALVHSRRRNVGEPGGFIVPSYLDPLDVPVLHFARGMVRLGDNFSVVSIPSQDTRSV